MTTESPTPASEQPTGYVPSLRDMVMLTTPTDVRLSPDGGRLAITVREANWNDNRYESRCMVHDLSSGASHWLTRTGSVSQVEWIDDHSLAVLKRESWSNGKAQVWLFEGLTGEGWQVTDHKTGVDWFKPFAGGILFCADDPERDERKERTDRFGTLTRFEQEPSASALYYTGLSELRAYQYNTKAATEEEANKLVKPLIELSRLLEAPLSIRSAQPSPTGDAIYLTCWPHDDLVYYRENTNYRIALDARAALTEYMRRERAKQEQGKEDEGESGEKEEKEEKEKQQDFGYLGELAQLNMPRSAYITEVSPDGKHLVIVHQGRDDKMYTQEDLWVIDVETALSAPDAEAFIAAMRNLTASLDRSLLDYFWVESGIYGTYVDGTVIRAVHLTHEQGPVTLDLGGIYPVFDLHASHTGRIAFVGTSATAFPEVWVADPDEKGDTWQCRQVTHFGQAVEGWKLGTVETIRWESRDGTVIEGVLRKPADFDPSRRYPLVLVVHGGPTWFSPEYVLTGEERSYYPGVQFVNQDVLVLKPNYRGSMGRGQAFLELNVNNLGVGDLWDIESGVDHLVGQGCVDPDKVGCMGWSQGGYISAFVGLHSDKFKAVSVGAGISDWYTYHISNDIPDFTVDYLSSSPFRDRALYEKTAPMRNLTLAKTPMLIQHGSEDRRVPFSNAMELYRGLKEMGVPVELFVYPGMGHPITRPRENHAVMYQNLAWFSHYLLGEELKLE
jgi:dipeptidyl aminopeptidase/acylaminoacyl peptidase